MTNVMRLLEIKAALTNDKKAERSEDRGNAMQFNLQLVVNETMANIKSVDMQEKTA